MKPHRFKSLEEIVAAAAETIRPPERLTVADAAEKYRYIDNPGNYTGPYTNALTPYNVEFQNILTSKEFQGAIFVGPAQCAKTEVFNNWVTYSAICDPADMLLINPTNTASRDFSKRRLARLYRDTAELQSRLLVENVFDTQFKSGMLLTLGHPAISELSGKPIPRLWLTDYDRMPQDVDKEGSPFDLAVKRATTFRRFGMTVAESSPGFVVENPKWLSHSKHEAPPTQGVLALYNRGDRRRWYWQCPDCQVPFEPSFSLLRWPDEGDDVFKAERAVIECPNCGTDIPHTKKAKLNKEGRWIKDGMTWNKNGSVTGTPMRSHIASFWLKGPAAAFAPWKTLVLNFLQASNEFEKTGSEEALKTTVNVDQGEAYIPQALMAERLPEELKSRAEDWGGTAKEPVVPEGVRYLMATIDVQAGMRPAFVVHVFGFGVGGDVWHIDMRKLRKSKRLDDDGEHENVDPAAYPEDWQIIVDEVIEKAYPLNDESGRYMQVKLVGCDSGGRAGVATNAYKFWRWLRDENESGHHKRFQLLKGEPSKTAQRYKVTYPDSQRRDRKAGARGNVPVGFINSNLQKDTVFAMLGRTEPGGGMVHFPTWAEDWLYTQLTAEVRTPKGWESVSKRRNEAFDLLYYAVSLQIDERIRGEKIDWEKPPGWARDWDDNDLVISKLESGGLVRKKRERRSLKELGEAMT